MEIQSNDTGNLKKRHETFFFKFFTSIPFSWFYLHFNYTSACKSQTRSDSHMFCYVSYASLFPLHCQQEDVHTWHNISCAHKRIYELRYSRSRTRQENNCYDERATSSFLYSLCSSTNELRRKCEKVGEKKSA